ncbi:MAG: hypothetical protein GY822_22195 [Deltaproteobacteria bacterium]|nr:hypothetical protein [Deltaproteobacteria bacterium]
MSRIWAIARRDLAGALFSWTGWVIIAALLLLHGLAFHGFALSAEAKSSSVIAMFFYLSSGFTAAAGILLSMRTFAEDRQTGTLTLLESSVATEWELVLGKFLGAYFFLLVYLALTPYMPALVFVNGSVSLSHIAVGYVGLALLGAAVVAVGTLVSSLSPSQLVAAVAGLGVTLLLFLLYFIGGKIEGALSDVVIYLDAFYEHYRSFTRGTFKASTAIYYFSLTYLALLAAKNVVQQKRWRG